jgi:glucose-6-phosphate-specific signal transduction histidine kinase
MAAVTWDDQAVQATTRRLVSRTESVALLAQGSWIATTAYVDKVTPQGARLLMLVAAGHAVAAVVAYVKGGPFVHGGGWKVLWVGMALLTPFVMGNLVPYGECGSAPSCVQLCGYPVPPIVFLAFYPWTGLAFSHLRGGLEVLLVFAFIAGPALVMASTHDYLTRDNAVSLLVTSSIYLLAFGVGRSIGRICREATRAQTEAARQAQKEELERTYNTLHDEIETALGSAAIHHGKADLERLGASLRRIQEIITRERTRSLLTKAAPTVAKIVDLQVDLVRGIIPSIEISPVGQLTVPQKVAELLASALAALLKNVREHSGADRVWIDVSVESGLVHVEVKDDGRGFAAETIEARGSALYELRERIRAAGGQLHKTDTGGAGSTLALQLPLK